MVTTVDHDMQRKLVGHLRLPTSVKLKYTDMSERLLWNLDDPDIDQPIIGRLVTVKDWRDGEMKAPIGFHQWEKWVPNEDISQAFELLHYVIERYQHPMGRLDFDLKMYSITRAYLLYSKRTYGFGEGAGIAMAICECLCNLQLTELVAKF